MCLFEKMNEIAYSKWLNNPNFKSPYWRKRVSVVAHGAVFGLEKETDLAMNVDNLFPEIQFDIKRIESRLNPIIENT
jgi:hypothetical protein